MSVLRKAGKIKVILTLRGIIGILSITAYVYGLKRSVPVSQWLTDHMQTKSPSADQADDTESSFSEQLPLGSLLGYNKAALPHIIMQVGPPPSHSDSPDLSTPATAVYSVLSLIDQAATDKLGPCFIEKLEVTTDSL